MKTAAEIVGLACQIASCPGFTTQGGQFLNTVLDDLCRVRDLKMNRVTASIVVQGGINGPFPLEANYLRTYDIFYEQNGLPYFLNPVSMKEYDAEFKDPGMANYPYEYATDMSGLADEPPTVGQLYLYPQSSGQITLTHRYMVDRPDIASPATSTETPWFPYEKYLIKATAALLMDITGDPRRVEFITECEAMLRPYLIMEEDQSGLVKRVELDPRHFRAGRSVRPTKLTD